MRRFITQKVAIVTDSVACLPGELVEQYRLRVVPINIHFDGRIYRNGMDITTDEAYKLLEKAPEQFASSPASIAEYLVRLIERRVLILTVYFASPFPRSLAHFITWPA